MESPNSNSRSWRHACESLALLIAAISFLSANTTGNAAEPAVKVLLIDGQNNHRWQETTPLIKAILEQPGCFSVTIATTPPKGADLSGFTPNFQDYDVVVSNYNGEPWPAETQSRFENFVRNGGGFVSVHAADNSFPKWEAYNAMIGVGGWGGRNEKSGPYVRWREGKFVEDTDPGRGGSHGRRHAFEVIVRDTTHPITDGIPASFLQEEDELYAELRGPASNMQVLATAFSDPGTNGTGEHEPMLMVINYGKGRVFHTTLGHDAKSMSGTAFQITLQRGTEWAATGAVTQPAVTAALMNNKEVVTRDPMKLSPFPSLPNIEVSEIPDIESDGWKSIFNGTDLSGWSQKNGIATYEVQEGTILGKTAKNSPNSFLCSENNYSDFELTFEVKVDEGLNSGVQIRSQSKPEFNDGRVHGPQVEIETGIAEAGYIYGEATGRGWLSPHQTKTDAFKPDAWNRYVIRAIGPRIQTWINGRMIEDLYDPESFQEGFLGLQVHGVGDRGPFEVRWRDIRVKEIQ